MILILILISSPLRVLYLLPDLPILFYVYVLMSILFFQWVFVFLFLASCLFVLCAEFEERDLYPHFLVLR